MDQISLIDAFKDNGVKTGDTVFIALDTSGGASPRFLSAVLTAIPEAFVALRLRKLVVLQFDTQVLSVDTFRDTNVPLARYIGLFGGGGTMFGPVAQVVQGMGGKKVFVVSDGYVFDKPPLGNLEVVWLQHSAMGSVTTPLFGVVYSLSGDTTGSAYYVTVEDMFVAHCSVRDDYHVRFN